MTLEISVGATSSAAPADIFALLKDGTTWPVWGFFKSFELVRAGVPDRFGVGAIREFTSSACVHEEVVALEPDRQLSYVLLSGMPFKGYRADVALEPLADGGTRIHWQAHFDVVYKGTGWFWKWMMTRVLARIAADLARGATDAGLVAKARDNLAQA